VGAGLFKPADGEWGKARGERTSLNDLADKDLAEAAHDGDDVWPDRLVSEDVVDEL